MQAADKGEPFDTDTGLPDSMAYEVSNVTWYQHACAFADARWPKVAAKGRISLVEGLMAVTPVLVTSTRGVPDPELLRQAMRKWAFNPSRRETPMPLDIEAALRWLGRSSVPVSALQGASLIGKALDAWLRGWRYAVPGIQTASATSSAGGMPGWAWFRMGPAPRR